MRKQTHSLDTVIRAAALSLIAGSAFASAVPARAVNTGEVRPTPVAGESWLNHLHRSFDETGMGKTGQLGPSSVMPGAEFARWQMRFAFEPAKEAVTLQGSDLYRMNCRGCHGADGQGAPPEINSVINPVRATSAAAVMERMRTAGMDMSRADAVKLAQQSQSMLLDRLHAGGQDMPAFPHLREAEVNSLIAYLRQLAGVRGAEPEQVAVRASQVRVGEQIVKSTCHICHGAAGPNPSPQRLYEGEIPPLNTLALRVSRVEFIRKVTQGAPVLMGAPAEVFRGRMPVFYYLSEEEASDVYLYLTRYPPYQWAVLDPVPMSAGTSPDPGERDPAPQVTSASYSVNSGRKEVPAAETKFATLPGFVALIAIALLGLGFAFTICELKRLSRTGKARKRMPSNGEENPAAAMRAGHRADRELVA